MKSNKSPEESDGFTVEFFKFFWNDLEFHCISFIFFLKELPISQTLGIIVCLPKVTNQDSICKTGDQSLFWMFSKLISGCIRKRIKSTLNYVKSDTQTRFLSGGYIAENTTIFIHDLMSNTENENKPGR